MTQADMWRWEAAKLRARAVLAEDPVTREQLAVFAEDCEEEARQRDGVEHTKWRQA